MKNLSTFPSTGLAGGGLYGLLLCVTLIAGFCLPDQACALDSNRAMSQYIHDKWDAGKGFLGGTVYAICQSTDGYLWLGTERGLVRFDGFSFQLIQQPIASAPPIGPVRGLVTDAYGNMWARVDGPHLLRYSQGKFDDAYVRLGMQDGTFTAMTLDNDGRLVLSGLSNQALRFVDGKFEIITNRFLVSGMVISLVQTRDRRLWMGTRDDGLFRVNQGNIANPLKVLTDTKVNALLSANSGGLWVGTDAGLEYWYGNALVKTTLPASMQRLQILALAKDRESNTWVGTDHGLIRILPTGVASLEGIHNGSGNEVTAVFEDHDGAVWYGGPKGLERLRDGLFTTYSNNQGVPAENMGPIYVEANGHAWFAPIAKGLFSLEDKHVTRMNQAGLNDDVIYSISGGGGEVWVGRQRGGLTLLTNNGKGYLARTYTQQDGLAQDSVASVHRNRDGTVWAGTVSGGVSKLKDGKFTTYSRGSGLISNAFNSIVEGFDQTMWFATPNGLESFKDGRWQNRSTPDGLPSPNVRTIFEDAEHVLWIATSGGLTCLASGTVKTLPNQPELLHEQIYGLAEDKRGFLWITTSDHVLRVNRDRLFAGSISESDVQSYGLSDGLEGVSGVRRDRSMVSDSAGRIWIPADRGLSIADPKLTLMNSKPVSVRIESVSVDGAAADLKDSPAIAAGSESITFDYAGTNLSVPERTRYRYRLEGSDKGWSDTVALRQVNYSHLGPGPYSFHVVASNSEGLWNGPEATVAFSIEPAIWQTVWFRALLLSACLLSAIALYRLRMYQLTRGLNIRFQERLAERTRIAQELHDTLLQGFLSASMQLDVAEDQLPKDSPTRPILKRILRLMQEVTEEGRVAVQGLRQTADSDRNLELAFSRMRQELVIDDNVSYRVIVQSTARPLRPSIRDEVYRIGREALVNAFLHAHATNVEVEVDYGSRYLRILVRDDGCGMDAGVLQAGREGHWGLPGMRERSEGIGATLKLRSRVGAGTEIELTVPRSVAYEGQSHHTVARLLPWLRREK